MKIGTSQETECFRTLRSPFLAKFKANASELDQERTQLRCYEDILLTGNCHKIC